LDLGVLTPDTGKETSVSVRRTTLSIAALAISAALTHQATAQDRPTNSDQELGIILGRPIDTTTPGDTAAVNRPTARRPLMSLFDQMGIGKSLDDLRLDIYGHAEVSYTKNADNPDSGFNIGRVFDFEDDEFNLNQIDLNVERVVNINGDNWDVGGRMEWMYGEDARYIHANGLFDFYDFFSGPENQFDLTQLYADINVPIGTGLRVRAGKFLFFKQVDPNASVFFSHSFTFGAALPFTLTGVTGYYNLTDRFNIEGGIVRGWDDALEDDNGSVSGVVRARYHASDQLNLSLAAITGPEQVDNNGDYRTAVNFVASYQVNSQLTFLLDSIYGYESDNPGSGASDWYGAAVYGIYKINDYISAALRLEYYRDDEGFTTGIAGSGLGFTSQDLYEATAGVTITPFAADELGRNLKIRPEVRYDYSSENFFDDFTEHDQLTFAVDAIFNF
jgi:hypothetical protein